MDYKNNIATLGSVAIFATLAVSTPVFALNPTIGNPSSDTSQSTSITGSPEYGQSFINDPSAGVSNIFLVSWTFDFTASPSGRPSRTAAQNQAIAAGKQLQVYLGTSKSGSLLFQSGLGSTAPVSGFINPVTWTFASATVGQTLAYTVLIPSDTDGFVILNSNGYNNGTLTAGTSTFSADAKFLGTFSATAVPFEFSPAGGIFVLGGLWARSQWMKTKK